MHYLEDFLEKLEYLPQEIKDCTSKIGQLDQQVKDSMNCIKENVDNLFSMADTMHPDDLDADFKRIMKFGDKALEKSDDKIGLANRMHDLLQKYISHVDNEIQKFKVDLDINRSGATELIEKNLEEVLNDEDSLKDEFVVVDPYSPNKQDLASYLQIDSIPTDLNQFPLSYTLEDMSESSAISVAAPKVKVSRKKSVKKLKSASLNASFGVIKCKKTSAESVALSPKLHISEELPQLDRSNKKQTKKRSKNLKQVKTNNSLDMSIEEDDIEPNDRHYCLSNEVAYSTMIDCENSKSVKKLKSASLNASFGVINYKKTSAEFGALSPKLHISEDLPQLDSSNKNQTKKRSKNLKPEKTNNSLDMLIEEDNIEPDDRRYCLCNDVAYSSMIGCDNSKCPYEWFHYECVGITSEPSGKWYCPKCVIKLKKRRHR